ncbi:MAG: hypothetical protein FWF51_02720 [Chitinivibrionia bacterium]|nr:hypothetical protein [Chitinivibrionia bacterium]
MKKCCFILLLCFIVNILADVDPTFTAPTEAGSALILYNAMGYNGYEFSQGAMETFRAALAQNINLINDPMANKNLTIPTINPPLTHVNILNCTSSGGIDADLKTKFSVNSTQIDGFPHDRALFDSLYNAGNPLAYWSQVYDLRFVNNYGLNASVISTSNTNKSDISYFREHLKTGGTLYIQAEYSVFEGRNNSIATVIKTFTLDKDYNPVNILGGGDLTSFNFSNDFENFAKDFNDLNLLAQQYPMLWKMAGGIPTNQIKNGISLITSGNYTIMAIWAPNRGLDPEIGNGRFIVGWDINAWGDYKEGIISTATFAIIQNLYDLMTGSKQYGIFKTFDPPEIELGVEGSFYITIKNNATYSVPMITVIDTISPCLQYIRSDTQTISENNLSGGAKELKWEFSIGGRSEKKIKIDYRVLKSPPCN